MTASRVRSKTGRRLSGGRNVYQRISPRLIRELVPAVGLPPKGIVDVRQLALSDGCCCVAGCVIGAANDDHFDDLTLGGCNASYRDDAFVNLRGDAMGLHLIGIIAQTA